MLRLPLSVLTLAFVPALASAQAVELGVVGGFFSPTNDFAIPSTQFGFGEGTGKHQTAFTYGALGRIWFDQKFGIEGTFLRSPSDVAVSQEFAPGQDTTFSATVTFGTVSAIMRFPVGDLPNPIMLSAGAVFVSHGGRAYRDLDNSSTLGGVVGLGTTFPMLSHLNVDIGFKGMIYSMALRDALGSLPSRTQTDLVGWAGLVYRFGREFDD